MARGILSGMIMGTLVAGVGAGALSLATELPEGARVASVADEAEAAADIRVEPAAEPVAEEAELPEPDAEIAEGDEPEIRDTSPEAADAEIALVAPDASQAPQFGGTDKDQAPQSSPQTALPEPSAEDSPSAETAPAEPQAEPEPETAEQDTAPVEPEPVVPAVPDEEREEIVLQVPQVKPDTEPGPEPETTAPEAGSTRVSIGTPARSLGTGETSSLPRIGGAAQDDGTAETSETTVDFADLPPVERFAEPFAGTDGTAKMAIVLIDDGTSDIGVEALTTFPYPLSFAVDTSWDGAADAMAKYRASGFEVLAMVNLPSGARASDVEVSMPVLLDSVPEAVGVMETPDAGLQASREVIAQVSEYVADSGHGLLLFPKGLNTAQKLAAKEGVPSATVFRDFDGRGQNASAVKRFLNHAALKAGSEGGVVMVGRLRADTISALLLWGLQDRADRVELAPVSQLLQVQGQG